MYFAHSEFRNYRVGTMNRTYTIILEPSDEGGFIVTVPALPKVGTQGDTRAEALANAREAIELVIEHRLARGEPLRSKSSATCCEPQVLD
jgi:predicted RNase H-like HicB family nuclease